VEVSDQEMSRVDGSDQEVAEECKKALPEENAAPEHREDGGMDNCGRHVDAAPEEAVADEGNEPVPSGLAEPPAGEDGSDEDGQESCRGSLRDLKKCAISEISPTAVDLAGKAVVPPEVLEYYRQFGIDERTLKILFQMRPPDAQPGMRTGAGISG
jgi:hypothetical protein